MCTAPAEAAAAPGFWLQDAHTLAQVGGYGLLSWRAEQLRNPPAMVLPLLRSLRRAGLLESVYGFDQYPERSLAEASDGLG